MYSQIKVGMRVRCVFHFNNTPYFLYGQEAIVVEINPGTIKVEWVDKNITHDQYWNNASSFEPVEDQEQNRCYNPNLSINQVVATRQEFPCQVCGKPNDVGIKICWCCGNNPSAKNV